jgi:hypothetical protein
VLERIRNVASFANVTATIALFAAVGGTSYAAISLPRNSVGDPQLRSRSIGADELKTAAIGSRAIRNRRIQLGDLSSATRAALSGQPGPPGPPGPTGIALRAAVSSSGGPIAGNATSSDAELPNKRLIGFSRSLAGCVPVATLARNAGGPVVDPGPGRIVATLQGDNVAVETFTPDGSPAFLPFNLIVAC